MIRLNMGCGLNLRKGWVNVDRMPYSGSEKSLGDETEFVQADLERFPWIWPDDSAEAALFNHSLEHMGRDPDVFIRIFQELYRVCRNGAEISIVVPHPRHDFFLGDITHVRAINELTFQNFSKKYCLECAARGYANTPFALYYDFDFEFVAAPNWKLSPEYQESYQSGKLGFEEVLRRGKTENNFIEEVHISLRVVKQADPNRVASVNV